MNLYLKVVGRRPDGYHELVTVMQPLSLADLLQVEAGGPGVTLEVEGAALPGGPENLVWRAAAAVYGALGREPRVRLRLHKRIPVAAGLGGGSSDAAGTLLAVNHLEGEPLSPAELHRLGAALGADVPFFLSVRPQVGRGIGTELQPLELPAYWYVLLNPGVAVATAWVYRSLDLEQLRVAGVPWRESWDGARPQEWVGNDLESVTLRAHPGLARWVARLKGEGALAAGMSGSGPTLFGLFWEKEAALKAARALRPAGPGWLAVARGLTGAEPPGWEDEVWMI